ETIATAAPFHFVNECCHEPCAAAAEGVTEGDGAAVDIQFLGIDPELSNASNNLGRKGLVQFDQIDLIDGQAGSFQRFLRGGDRSYTHVVWMNPGGSGRDDSSHRLQFELLSPLRRGQQKGRRTIGNRRGESSRDRAPLFVR